MKRSEYQKRMKEQLDLWSGRLDVMKTKSGALFKVENPTQYAEWKGKGDAARAKLKQLIAIGDQWEAQKREMETAMRGLDADVPRDPPKDAPIRSAL